MEIIHPPTLIPTLKNKHLLLDTNLFRDVAIKPSVFNDFFGELKNAGVTIAIIDLIKYELLKGSTDEKKYQIKETLIDDIVDVTIPLMPQTYQLVYKLIKIYGIEGAGLSITDLFLGALLMQYKENIYLLTRDTTDFIQRVFNLSCIVNMSHPKGIFTYGLYQYTK